MVNTHASNRNLIHDYSQPGYSRNTCKNRSLVSKRTVTPLSSSLEFYHFFLFFIYSINFQPRKTAITVGIELSNCFLKIKFIIIVTNSASSKISVDSNIFLKFLFFFIVKCLRFNNGITHTFKKKVCVIRFFMKDH